MSARVVVLAEALKTVLADQLDKPVVRRYTPYVTGAQLASERISVFIMSDESTIQSRAFDSTTYQVAVEVSQSLPESGQQSRIDPDADLNNLEFLDARMQTIESIKDLFKDDGPLREERIGDCYFQSLEHSPLFNPDALLQDRIFSAVLTLTFSYAGNE